MKPLEESELLIVGTGLMGASLALALRGKVKALHGVDSDLATAREAAAYFDATSNDLESSVATADVIVLAVPVRAILILLDRLKTLAKPGTLILDLGSAKQDIVAAMGALPNYLLAVGGHPMCGKERSGPQAAEAAVYSGCSFVLCPTQRTTAEVLSLAQQIVEAAGARPIILDAERHDSAVAAVSHLPYLVSTGLVATVQQAAQNDDTPWRLAASGFRDTSRLAASDVTMMGDTILANREAVLRALDQFLTQLTSLRDQLDSAADLRHEGQLRAKLESIRQARLTWSGDIQHRR